jgi:hypothetical protein
VSEQAVDERGLGEQTLDEQPVSREPGGARADPRLRPSDPAGTQPKVDPRSLESPPRLGPGQATFLPAPAPPQAPDPAAPATALTPAGTLTPTPATPALPAQPATPAAPPASRPAHPHAPRFQFLLGALGALGVCALGVLVLLLSAPKATPAKPWSAWRPTESGVDPAQQIAAHVAPEYRLDNGRQIAAVTGGPPTLQGQPMTVGESRSGHEAARLEGNSVLYQVCGGGHACAIKEGKPSAERALLLGREALELALYTFRYVDGVDQVIVTIPPSPAVKSPTRHALMFRSEDVSEQLARPLSSTLSPTTPRVSQMDGSVDAPLVRQLTGTRLYDYIAEAAPQGGAVMLLSPFTS